MPNCPTTRTRILPRWRWWRAPSTSSWSIRVVAKSIADLIAAAKAEPDKLSYGTYGTGTSAHLAGELFKHMAGVNLTTVPYRGSAPAITDLIGGQIEVIFTTVASAASLIEAGPLRAHRRDLGGRSPAFPQLPTVAEAGVPGYAPKPGTASMRPPRRHPTSSTASTGRRRKPCSPRPSRSSAQRRAGDGGGAAGRVRPLFCRRGGRAGARSSRTPASRPNRALRGGFPDRGSLLGWPACT